MVRRGMHWPGCENGWPRKASDHAHPHHHLRLATLPDDIAWLRETITGVVADRCANEGGWEPSVADILLAVLALLGLSRQ